LTVTRIWYRYDAVRVRQALRDNVSLHATRVSRERKFDRRPLWLVRGDGSAVRGVEGKGTDSLDLLAGFCFVKAGYVRSCIAGAMTSQSETLLAAVLADRIGGCTPLGDTSENQSAQVDRRGNRSPFSRRAVPLTRQSTILSRSAVRRSLVRLNDDLRTGGFNRRRLLRHNARLDVGR